MAKPKKSNLTPSRTARKQGTILKIRLSSTTTTRVLRFVRGKVSGKKRKTPFLITTPNPEILIQAQNDPLLMEILNSSDYSIPDGTGLIQATRFLASFDPKFPLLRLIVFPVQGLIVGLSTFFAKDWLFKSLNIIKGRNLFLELIKLSNKMGWRVFLLGDKDKSAEKAKERLETSFKKIEIYTANGPNLTNEAEPLTKKDKLIEKKIIEKINKIKPHLLFVGFGVPKQEKWSYKWMDKLTVGGVMVVGGTFDYVSGKVKLPPKWLEDMSLEWAWRLMVQPNRLKRILTAFPYFPLKVFWYKLTK